MELLIAFLETVRTHHLAEGHLRGFFNVVIGRRITRLDGTVVSTGVTWRVLAQMLKDLRFNKDLVKELGADPDDLSPRDRQRMWYSAIALARPDSVESVNQGERFAKLLKPHGYMVGIPPQVNEATSPPDVGGDPSSPGRTTPRPRPTGS